MLKKVSEFIKSLQQKQKRTLVGITAALIAIAIVTAVETPSFVSASSNTSRQLPIYSVERDQKMVSLSFDAAWGNDFCGNAR